MTIHRFYIGPERWDVENLRLEGAEAHHCVEVLRLRSGDRVIVFDGQGTEVTAEISALSKREVGLVPLFTRKTAPPPARITLAQAIPKGKNMDLILQKATELGVSRVVPLISERTVVRLSAAECEEKREKWQRVVVEACKQCGQNHLPVVETPVAPERFFAVRREEEWLLIAAIAEDARGLKALLAERQSLNPGAGPPQSVLMMIGPEGDFTPAEVGLAMSAGCQAMSLGPIILRTETAALYTLSVLGHELFAPGGVV